MPFCIALQILHCFKHPFLHERLTSNNYKQSPSSWSLVHKVVVVGVKYWTLFQSMDLGDNTNVSENRLLCLARGYIAGHHRIGLSGRCWLGLLSSLFILCWPSLIWLANMIKKESWQQLYTPIVLSETVYNYYIVTDFRGVITSLGKVVVFRDFIQRVKRYHGKSHCFFDTT